MIGACNACGLQVAHGARVGYKWRVEHVFNSQKLQSAHVLSSMASLGWVLFGIGYVTRVGCKWHMEHVWVTSGAWSTCSTVRSFSRRMSYPLWLVLVGFCSGLAIMSRYALTLTV